MEEGDVRGELVQFGRKVLVTESGHGFVVGVICTEGENVRIGFFLVGVGGVGTGILCEIARPLS